MAQAVLEQGGIAHAAGVNRHMPLAHAAVIDIVRRRPRVLLVTSAFHMRRAQRLFERQGLKVLTFPVDFRRAAAGRLPWRDPNQWLPSARALDDSSRALRKLIGLVYRSW